MTGFFALRACPNCRLHFADRWSYVAHRQRRDREAKRGDYAPVPEVTYADLLAKAVRILAGE